VDMIMDKEGLRTLFGTINPLATHKVQTRLDEHLRRFIALSPFVILATADGVGNVDASPRGDAPGFVLVLDDQTLLLPDRPGNNRADSFTNILVNPGVALLFFVPGVDETVRVNGKARIVTDSALLTRVEANGKLPRAGLVIAVEKAFFHCGKALKRSRLWQSESRIDRASFPTLGRIIADQTGQISAKEAESQIASDYEKKLY
jgi:PPOX class probable FMN-dependent enzyme